MISKNVAGHLHKIKFVYAWLHMKALLLTVMRLLKHDNHNTRALKKLNLMGMFCYKSFRTRLLHGRCEYTAANMYRYMYISYLSVKHTFL